mmetsp:Transcript_6530/g.20380  ORF Transcript_6530/g.20380 Transcript_6530/m.20380 type:complete len:80 (+) Transcript_6530:586-825(+)
MESLQQTGELLSAASRSMFGRAKSTVVVVVGVSTLATKDEVASTMSEINMLKKICGEAVYLRPLRRPTSRGVAAGGAAR